MLFWMLTACLTAQDVEYHVCDLVLSPVPDTIAAGESFVLAGGPMTSVRDSAVQIDGTQAPVTDLSRTATECALCASCRSTELCNTCETCAACEATCSGCVESVTVRVPDTLPGGTYPLTLVNAFGTGATTITISAPVSSTGDTGTNP